MADCNRLCSFSYPSGEPPTPTRTPTSPNFFLNSFQTPKQDSRSYGQYSPWTPTFASAASPDLKTPTRLRSPTKSSKTPTSKDVDSEIASHVHHPSPNPSLPLPPVESSRRLSSSPNLTLATGNKRRRVDVNNSAIPPLKTTSGKEAGNSMSSARSMQTPPPTSTSASRRKAQQDQVARLVKESAEKGRRMSFPSVAKMDSVEFPNPHVEESPQHFPSLQFSPEGLGFPNSGPATAPVYPQNKLFWEPEQGGDTMNIDFAMDDTFTAFGTQKNLDPFGSGHGGIEFPASPAFNLLGTQSEDTAPFTTSDHVGPSIATSTSLAMGRKSSHGTVVNPSLLFSSPGRAAELSNLPPTSQAIQDDNLLPYAHQLREAQMELEMQMSRKLKRKRGPEIDSPAVKAALQTLRDDRDSVKSDLVDEMMPSSGGRRPSSRNSAGKGARNQIFDQRSLRKQESRNRLDSLQGTSQQKKRTSVTFTIDANGRAKTETKIMTNDDGHSGGQMDVSSDEDSESSSSSSNDEMVMSQTQSFAYPQNHQQPKLGRFTHKSHSHSQKSSYASTVGSSNKGRSMTEGASRRPSSNLYIQSNARKDRSSTGFNRRAREEIESEAETVFDSEDDKGDAQSALKKVLQSRPKKGSKGSMGSGSRTNYAEQRRTLPPQTTSAHPYYLHDSLTPTRGYHAPYNNTSPTTITDPDMTPSTAHSNLSNDSVNCLCQANEDDGQLMIQWYVCRRYEWNVPLTLRSESCRKWQHVRCLGLPQNPEKLPSVHLCLFCTATPSVRGARAREPVRAAFPPPSSPLAHKSYRYR